MLLLLYRRSVAVANSSFLLLCKSVVFLWSKCINSLPRKGDYIKYLFSVFINGIEDLLKVGNCCPRMLVHIVDCEKVPDDIVSYCSMK